MEIKLQAIALDATDNVATLLEDAGAAAEVSYKEGEQIRKVILQEEIKFGHKVAIKPINQGDKIIKYGKPIGLATQTIRPGEHVHIHNVVGLRC